MPARFTQEQVFEKCKAKNFTLLGKYFNSATKVLVKCHCQKTFYVKVGDIFSGRTTSCGCVFKKKLIERNKKFYSGQEIGYLKIIEAAHKNSSGRRLWKSQCLKCKKIVYKDSHSLRDVNPSCGKCYKRIKAYNNLFEEERLIQGKIYRKLKVLSIAYIVPNAGQLKCVYKCVCLNCDKVCFVDRKRIILCHRKVTCGNCGLYKNGRRTSQQNIILFNYITYKKKYHNFQLKTNLNIDIAVFSKKDKIAIEYDSYYWHRIKRNMENKEKERDRILIKEGWKVLRVRSGTKTPSKNKLNNSIKQLINGKDKYKEIVLDDWGRK